ncbi:MAG TPA: aromatic ring-hydroxylating dioxygenase subunit alpha [Chloroflexota bacterium]|nr:aromatic ring-hydroxylating dioxygenase subunit alpha [Chloroflexota bacterium]
MVTSARTQTEPVMTLPGRYYHDPAIFALEQERLFATSWVCVGRADSIPAPGAYFLAQVALENAIVLRDKQGEIHAFLNVCRHRGARLCIEERGQLRSTIQCRYHAWTYALNGRLVGAPNMKEDPSFDPDRFGLMPVVVEVWEGLIWLNLSDDPQPLGEQIGAPYTRYAHYHVGELQVARTIVYDVQANWKLVVENFNECYHCAIAHPELSAQVPSFKAGYVSGYGGNGALLADGVESLTVSGKTSRPLLRDLHEEGQRRYYGMTLRPNMFMNLHPDYVLTHVMQPLAADRTRIVCNWLFEPETMARPDFDPSDAVEFWDLVNRQDWEICAITQLSMQSKVYRDGGMYAPQEHHIRDFNDYVLRKLGHA